MNPQAIDPNATPQQVCQLAERWGLDLRVATGITKMAGDVPYGLEIISGFRTCAQEQLLREQGRPAIPCSESNHTICPARAADLWPTIAVTNAIKADLGRAAVYAGLRWGGGSPVDPSTGIPSDWNHVDLGPRNAS